MSIRVNSASRPLEPRKRAIIIGASSGTGAALAKELAASGYSIAVLARRIDLLKSVCEAANEAAGSEIAVAFQHDVTSYDEIPDLFRNVLQKLGGLDLIIYVAGVQPPVALNEYSFEKDVQTIQTNLIGAVAWLNLAAARFEQTRTGHIVGISSIAGDRGRVGSPVYNTSKAALNTYLEALRNRLSRQGVVVTTIKPGFVDTENLKNAAKTFWVISPETAAEQIRQAIEKKRLVAYVPARWGLVGLVIRHIPSFLFRRLSF